MTSKPFRYAGAAGAFLLAACGWLLTEERATMAEATGEWILEDGMIDGRMLRIPADVQGKLNIQPGRFDGHSGCNSFGGDVSESDRSISVGSLIQTAMGCANEVNQFEASFVEALRRATELHRTGNALTVLGSGVELHFTSAPN